MCRSMTVNFAEYCDKFLAVDARDHKTALLFAKHTPQMWRNDRRYLVAFFTSMDALVRKSVVAAQLYVEYAARICIMRPSGFEEWSYQLYRDFATDRVTLQEFRARLVNRVKQLGV